MGLMVSFMIFTASVRKILDQPLYISINDLCNINEYYTNLLFNMDKEFCSAVPSLALLTHS